ncbi:hypothetical protein, partial [Labrys miyagiensis]|uniref:hypothetical protein n=1 Tax=Labrys miyagiensis TaxID=346912 RepID=UPI0024E14308
EVVKDAYKALKAKLTGSVAEDVAELEQAPDSKSRMGVIAEIVDGLPTADQEELRRLAQALTSKLEEAGPIGFDARGLKALNVELGKIDVTEGTGASFRDATITGTLKAGDIKVGKTQR